MASDEAKRLLDEEHGDSDGASVYTRQPQGRCARFGRAVVNGIKEITPVGWVKISILLFLLAAAAVVLIYLRRRLDIWLFKLLDWIQSVGYWGMLVLGGFYIACTIFFVPGSILTLGAGYVYDLVAGTIVVSISSTFGAFLAFLLGRTLLRSWVAKRIERYTSFAAVDKAIQSHGLYIVFLLRLSPVIPFNLLNYALGITNVLWWHYLLASWIGMLPGTVLYVYLGSVARDLTDIASGKATRQSKLTEIFFFAGLGVCIIAVVLIVWVSRRAIKKALAEAKNKLEKEKEEQSRTNKQDATTEGNEYISTTSIESVGLPNIDGSVN